MRQTAAHPAAGRHREIVDTVGDTGGIHQVSGQNEERHRQQRKAVEPSGHAVQDHEVRDMRDEVRVEQRRQRQRDEHRHAGEQYRNEDENQNRHRSTLLSIDGDLLGDVGSAPPALSRIAPDHLHLTCEHH